jgi:hypothetical protein
VARACAAANHRNPEDVMRGIGRWLAMAAVVGTAGCSPGLLSGGMTVAPSCGAMQARAYHTTSQFTTRQRVAAIQARYSMAYLGAQRGNTQGWRGLASGECSR